MLLIMGADIVLGPLLTLVVYKAGKKSLRFDLACIVTLQAGAFSMDSGLLHKLGQCSSSQSWIGLFPSM